MSSDLESNESVAEQAEESNQDPEVEGLQLKEQGTQPNVSEEGSSEDDDDDDDDTDAISHLEVSPKRTVNDLESLLNDIYERYVAIRWKELDGNKLVLEEVFLKLHESMKRVDPYYNRYCRKLTFRPEELNMIFLIELPGLDSPESKLNDIVVDVKHAMLAQLQASVEYQENLEQEGPDFILNKQASSWIDDKNYILRSKFISWFQSIVNRALNEIQNSVMIDGTKFNMTTSSTGAACTLSITNDAGLRVDVNLVPALKSPNNRLKRSSLELWSKVIYYVVDNWTVVAHPIKFGANNCDGDRTWVVDMYDQEKKLVRTSFHLKAMRLLKKLRNAQQMDYIQYYKTDLMLQLMHGSNLSTVFQYMLDEFYDILADKKISFSWNAQHDCIEKVPEYILKEHIKKLKLLVEALKDPDKYMAAAVHILTLPEYTEYRRLLRQENCNS